MKKRILSLLLVFVLVLGMVPTVFATTSNFDANAKFFSTWSDWFTVSSTPIDAANKTTTWTTGNNGTNAMVYNDSGTEGCHAILTFTFKKDCTFKLTARAAIGDTAKGSYAEFSVNDVAKEKWEKGTSGSKSFTAEVQSGQTVKVDFYLDNGFELPCQLTMQKISCTAAPAMAKVTFNYNDGATENTEASVEQGKAIGAEKIPTPAEREGYVFDGWYNGEELLTENTVVSSDTTYTARWAEAVTLTFLRNATAENGGAGPESFTKAVKKGEAFDLGTLTLPFTKAGYHFRYWADSRYADVAESTDVTTDAATGTKTITPTKDKTYYANWIGNPLVVTYDYNDGSNRSVTKVNRVGSGYRYDWKSADNESTKQDNYDLVADPTRDDGYAFAGWYTEKTGGEKFNPNDTKITVTAEDAPTYDPEKPLTRTYYAHWDRAIVVNYDGGADYKWSALKKQLTLAVSDVYSTSTTFPQKVQDTSDYYAPKNMLAEGTDSKWWLKKDDGSYEELTKDTDFGDAKEITLYIRWRNPRYTIIFNANGANEGSTMANVTADFNANYTLPACTLEKEGYEFAGWGTTASASPDSTSLVKDQGTLNRTGARADDGKTYQLYAIWKKAEAKPFTITFYSPDKTKSTTETDVLSKEDALSKTLYAEQGYDTHWYAESDTEFKTEIKTYADAAALADQTTDRVVKLVAKLERNGQKTWDEIAADKLDAALAALEGVYTPRSGRNTKATYMLRDKLIEKEISGVTTSIKGAAYSEDRSTGIADGDGEFTYRWIPDGENPADKTCDVVPTVVLSCVVNGKTYTRETTGCTFKIGLNRDKALEATTRWANKLLALVPDTITSQEDLKSVPQYLVKDGVDASKVDYTKTDDLITTFGPAKWESNHTDTLAFAAAPEQTYGPYAVTVTIPEYSRNLTVGVSVTYPGTDITANPQKIIKVEKEKEPVLPIDYQETLDAVFTESSLYDPATKESVDLTAVTTDIHYPTTRDLGVYTKAHFNQGFDGAVTPVVIESSDGTIITAPDTPNSARTTTYRPLPGQGDKTVTVTVKIMDRPGGAGTAMGKTLATKSFTITVKEMAQSEIDAAAAFMNKAATDSIYWLGIKNANTSKDNITGDLDPFFEILPDGNGGYRFVREEKDTTGMGIKADAIPGWYDSQMYRAFRSSAPLVISHENLLLTKPEYDTKVTIDSVLTYTEYAKYYEKFGETGDYAQFKQFYKHPVSATVTVKGTKSGETAPKITVTVTFDGQLADKSGFTDITGASYTCTQATTQTAKTAAMAVLGQNNYTYVFKAANYLSSITDDKKVTLAGGDETYGPWSGWMYTVNGEVPTGGQYYDETTGTFVDKQLTIDEYQLQDKDVIRFYYVQCPTTTGLHIAGKALPEKKANCHETGLTAGHLCSVCPGVADGREVIAKDPTNHSGIKVMNAKASTCKTKGHTEWTFCVDCNTTVTASTELQLDPSKHETIVDVAEVPSTCTTAGTAAGKKCEACDTVTEGCTALPLDTSNHEKIVDVAEVPSTCTTAGTAAGKKCESCGRVTEGCTALPLAPHSWDAGVVTKEPTTTSEGERTYTCAVCRTTKTERIAKLPAPPVVPSAQPSQPSQRPDAGSQSRRFQDVPTGAWFESAVYFNVENGLFSGVTADLFAPHDAMTRAMLVTVLYRMEGAPAAGTAAFEDVAAGKWYSAAIAWANENGVVQGMSAARFAPSARITREQLAVTLFRYAKLKGYDVSARADLAAFADAGQVSSWAAEAMQWAVASGLISGRSGAQLAPQGEASRAEVAMVLMNFMRNIVK